MLQMKIIFLILREYFFSLLYDLIYNPAETTFLKFGKNLGATIQNGSKMLELQAEKAWSIWDLS